MEDEVKVIKLGLGEVTTNWGTYYGVPSVFIEPAPAAGVVGERDGSKRAGLRPGSVVLQIHDQLGAFVLMEDLMAALVGSPLSQHLGQTFPGRPKPVAGR